MTPSNTLRLTQALWPALSHTVTYADIADRVGQAPTVAPDAEPVSPRFDKSTEQKEYIRPNGMKYVPRTKSVDGVNVHDVTLVRKSIEAGLPVLLYGEPGCGKTALVEAAFGEDLYTVQGTVETETADFVGSWVQNPDGTYGWVDGPLILAMIEGKKLLVDEIALIDSRVMAVVYGVMDGRGELVVTQNPLRGTVHVESGFAVIGACNPNVPGAQMSDALLSRFIVHIEMTTDWSIASKLGVPAKITQVVRNLNQKFANGEVTQAPQLRELIAFRDVSESFGEAFALQNFISQIREENRGIAAAQIASVFGADHKPLVF
jgi:MoxR-like ATPase